MPIGLLKVEDEKIPGNFSIFNHIRRFGLKNSGRGRRKALTHLGKYLTDIERDQP